MGMKVKVKQILFYVIWAFILFYLYTKFADIHPFGKNSSFYKTGCSAEKVKISKDSIKYDGFGSTQ